MKTESAPPISQLPRAQYAFPGELRDTIVTAILAGEKTATSSLLAEYELGGETLPEVGLLEAVVDSHDNVVCVTRVKEVKVVPVADVDDSHAIAEGEGYQNSDEWRLDHERFLASHEYVTSIGRITLSDSTSVVCVSFELDKRYPTREITAWDET
ncbi:MAG: ASCH domain-containing protein [Actinomycetaceae bacterium]|nr:ASCH domain-containing protein [Actinomycetaceae bacterium]